MEEKKLTVYEFPTIEGDNVRLEIRLNHQDNDAPLEIVVGGGTNGGTQYNLTMSRKAAIKLKHIINDAV